MLPLLLVILMYLGFFASSAILGTFYTGPIVAHLGGADISWILGLIVSSALYYLLLRHQAVPALGDEPESDARVAAR